MIVLFYRFKVISKVFNILSLIFIIRFYMMLVIDRIIDIGLLISEFVFHRICN
jgi:hypothetical protein